MSQFSKRTLCWVRQFNVQPAPDENQRDRVLGHAIRAVSGSETAMAATFDKREKRIGPIPTLSPEEVPIDALPIVTISETELSHVKRFAKQRAATYDDIANEEKYKDQNLVRNHVIGLIGEVAIYKLYGGTLDLEVYENSGDGGYDLYWDGWNDYIDVDVKATEYSPSPLPDLFIPASQDLQADLYILCHVLEFDFEDGAKVRIVGMAHQRRVKTAPVEEYPSNRMNRRLRPQDLTVPPLLKFGR